MGEMTRCTCDEWQRRRARSWSEYCLTPSRSASVDAEIGSRLYATPPFTLPSLSSSPSINSFSPVDFFCVDCIPQTLTSAPPPLERLTTEIAVSKSAT